MSDEGFREAVEVERYLRSMFDAMFEGIQILDPEWRYVYLNETAAAQGRRPRDELMGTSLPEAYPGIEETELFELLARCMAAREPGHRINRFTYPDGDEGWFDLRVSPTPEGGLLILSIDVTAQRAADEMLHQSQKMEAVGRLAGGVAHDFNNVLSVITSYTDVMLSRLGEEDRFRGELTEVKRAAEHAASLTRQLLGFSRKRVLNPEVLDLTEAVTDLEGMLRRIIGEDIDLVVRPAVDLHPVRFDLGHVQQILMNLVVNARDAMPDGGTLTIETANGSRAEPPGAGREGSAGPGASGEAEPGDSYVVLTVTDTGVGMDEATRARIFEPFFTTKELGRGTGLGLATIYGIVSQGGGRITVDSELERGTTFHVYLPRADPSLRPAGSGPARSPAQARGETVLVIEDDPSVRGVIRVVLGMGGYTVLDATGEDDALEQVRSSEHDVRLVLTDIVLPGTSGQAIARRALAERPDLRVAFMSGYRADAAATRGELDPGTVFVEKPFTAAELLDAVGRALA